MLSVERSENEELRFNQPTIVPFHQEQASIQSFGESSAHLVCINGVRAKVVREL